MSYRDGKNSYRIDTDDAAAMSRLYPVTSKIKRYPQVAARWE